MTTKKSAEETLAFAVSGSFISPNVSDSNGEAANIVDVLAQLSQAIFALARSIDGLAGATMRDPAAPAAPPKGGRWP